MTAAHQVMQTKSLHGRQAGGDQQPRARLHEQHRSQASGPFLATMEPQRVEPIHLFDIAAQQARWLSTSQAVVANNVANANTPGFRAQSVQPFDQVLDRTQLSLASTNSAHLSLTPADQQAAAIREDDAWETTDSGNTVSLEQEMIKAGEVNRNFALNTNLVKAFHGMLMASVRS